MVDPTFQTPHVTLYTGDVLDVLRQLPDESVDCCVTSPPYWGLRDYGVPGQLGLEPAPDEYVAKMVEVFREVRRVLRDTGTLWLNLGDSYAGSGPSGASYQSATTIARASKTRDGAFAISKTLSRRGLTYAEKKPVPPPGLKPKDLVGIPWRVAFALQADGWWLRSDIVWSKPNPMPESVTDRPTKAHEYIFLLSKSERYFYDADAIAEPAVTDAWPGIGPQHGTERDRNEKYEPMKVRKSVVRGGFNGKTNAMPGREAFRAIVSMRNSRTVWEIPTQPYPEAHFATFPRELPERCIKAGCPADGTVLDPFAGSGTTLAVARDLGRKAIGIELNPEYVRLIEKRCAQLALELGA